MSRMVFLGLVLVAVFVYSEYDRFTRGGHDTLQSWIAPAITLLLLLGAYGVYLWLLRPAIIGWMCRGTALRETLGPTSMVLAPDGIEIENPHGRGRIEWAHIRDVAETPEHLFLITGHLRALIIPKRAFDDRATATSCPQALRDWMDAAKAE